MKKSIFLFGVVQTIVWGLFFLNTDKENNANELANPQQWTPDQQANFPFLTKNTLEKQLQKDQLEQAKEPLIYTN
ncbi:hypothetical protein [Persicobacter psychrovividus]|uniref:Uncharacterized protein n=1 Tax=Persicobacter psychrovividus TaxID=387638 RepID=A0ABM7VG25_9BACT|nr:hypothetical protein PEPS_21930 [Persicobacter psychrovividus]